MLYDKFVIYKYFKTENLYAFSAIYLFFQHIYDIDTYREMFVCPYIFRMYLLFTQLFSLLVIFAKLQCIRPFSIRPINVFNKHRVIRPLIVMACRRNTRKTMQWG